MSTVTYTHPLGGVRVRPTPPTSIPAIIEKGVTYVNPAPLGLELWGDRYNQNKEQHSNGFDNCAICGRALADESKAKWVAVDSTNAGFVAVLCSQHRASLALRHTVGHSFPQKLHKAHSHI